MTREEIEKGRKLLAQYAESGVHTDGFLEAMDWFFGHASDLLSLAEESRWRDVEEESPKGGSNCIVAYGIGLQAVAYSDCSVWRRSSSDSIVGGVTHWRPLPRVPGER